MRRWAQTFIFWVLCGAWFPFSARAGDLFIDPSDMTVIRRTVIPFESEVVLRLGDLAAGIDAKPGVAFGEQKFSSMALSSDGQSLAFSVDGTFHDWGGVYVLGPKRLQRLTIAFDAELQQPYWFGEDRYLVFEKQEDYAQSSFEIFDLKNQSSCRLQPVDVKNKYLNITGPWWDAQQASLFFSVRPNARYRRAMGLKPLDLPAFIGKADPHCGHIALYPFDVSIAEISWGLNMGQMTSFVPRAWR